MTGAFSMEIGSLLKRESVWRSLVVLDKEGTSDTQKAVWKQFQDNIVETKKKNYGMILKFSIKKSANVNVKTKKLEIYENKMNFICNTIMKLIEEEKCFHRRDQSTLEIACANLLDRYDGKLQSIVSLYDNYFLKLQTDCLKDRLIKIFESLPTFFKC